MLKKDEKDKQLVYYQARHYDSRFLNNIVTHLHGSIGWHWDVYYSRSCYTTCGKIEKDHRHGLRQSP